jgi:hypothetical protein
MAMLVTLIEPGRSPGRAPVVMPRLAVSSLTARGASTDGAGVAAAVGAGVTGVRVRVAIGVGVGVAAAAAMGAADGLETDALPADIDDATAGTTRTAIRAMAAATRPR